MQVLMKKAILAINQYITEVNESNQMVTPYLANTVIEYRGEKIARVHYKTLKDGVHPNDKLVPKWAKRMQHVINVNRRFDSPPMPDIHIPSSSDCEPPDFEEYPLN